MYNAHKTISVQYSEHTFCRFALESEKLLKISRSRLKKQGTSTERTGILHRKKARKYAETSKIHN